MSRPAQPSDPPIRVAAMASGPFSYTDEGEGPVVVAVPGYPGGPRDFRWLAPALGTDVRFIRLAMPAFEQTPLETEPAPDLVGRADFVARALQALDLTDVLLVGHSMGGGLAGIAATLVPERVRGLGLICSIGPTAHPSVRGPGLKLASQLCQRPVVGWPFRKFLPRGFEQMGFPRRWTVPQLMHTLDCAAALDFAEWAGRMPNVACPTLVAWGLDDPLLPVSIEKALAASVPDGPRLEFADGGHNIQKHHAVELGRALREMVGLSPDPPGSLPAPPVAH
jgi:pimeloyl-ACP methyl ester carboxylesterase